MTQRWRFHCIKKYSISKCSFCSEPVVQDECHLFIFPPIPLHLKDLKCYKAPIMQQIMPKFHSVSVYWALIMYQTFLWALKCEDKKHGPCTFREMERAEAHESNWDFCWADNQAVVVVLSWHKIMALWPIPLTKKCSSSLYCTPHSAYTVPILDLCWELHCSRKPLTSSHPITSFCTWESRPKEVKRTVQDHQVSISKWSTCKSLKELSKSNGNNPTSCDSFLRVLCTKT